MVQTAKGRTGLNPLSYLGVEAPTPPQFMMEPRAPTPKDAIGVNIGTLWLDISNFKLVPQQPPKAENIWMLVSLLKDVATWVNFGGGGAILSLTGDLGGPVFGDINFNINTLGTAGQILVTGNPATHTLNWSLDGSVANIYQTDFQSPAIPAGNILQIKGGISLDAEAIALVFRKNIHTAANPMNSNLLEVKLNDSISLPNTTANGLEGVVYMGGAVAVNRFMHNFGTNNTFLGNTSGNLTLTVANATGNVGIGNSSLVALTTGANNAVLGSSAGSVYTTESGNICIGQNVIGRAGESDTIRIINPAGGFNNIFIGQVAGNNFYTVGTALQNVGIGAAVFNELTTGQHNIAMGSAAAHELTTGSLNCALGDTALTILTTGSSNTAVGALAGQFITVSSQNTAIGQAALQVITGANNTCLGFNAGVTYVTNESNNIAIGNPAVVGDNNTTRIGSGTGVGAFQQNRCFISGIRGITTANADAIAVLIDSAGQLGTISSSIRYKEKVKDMGDYSENLMHLRPVTFKYKKDLSEQKSVGLIAEEVADLFPELVIYNEHGYAETVRYHDLPVLLLNELQKLSKRVKELEEKYERSE